jgi:ribosomal protein S18 acetylase RimI-like enzyme
MNRQLMMQLGFSQSICGNDNSEMLLRSDSSLDYFLVQSTMPTRHRKSLLRVLLLLALASFQARGWSVSVSSSVKIAPPRSSRAWRQLASLLVDIFDDYSIWEWTQRRITENFVVQQYVDTTKRMRGNKYALLVATRIAGGNDVVVGMVEMGLSAQSTTTTNNNNNSTTTTRTTIGVLAVSPKFQQQGIGTMLLEQCETAAATVWNKTTVYAQVEPDNDVALRFFERHGYTIILQESSSVMVRRRRVLEERPHLLLSKEL